MRVALFVIVIFCGIIAEELGGIPNSNRNILGGIAGGKKRMVQWL